MVSSTLKERIAVLTRHFAHIAAAAVTLFALGPSPALSRQWKATPEAVARDYATINDTRAGGELILLLWFVPQMAPSNSTGADILAAMLQRYAAMLQRYVVIVAVHGHLERTTGTLSFEDIDGLKTMDQTGKPLTPVARGDLPPTNIAMLAAIEGLLRQSLGAMGKGMKIFVFDARGVDSCKQGQLEVPLASETYTWDTPFPGCPQN
jgi:hypothetical protein